MQYFDELTNNASKLEYQLLSIPFIRTRLEMAFISGSLFTLKKDIEQLEKMNAS